MNSKVANFLKKKLAREVFFSSVELPTDYWKKSYEKQISLEERQYKKWSKISSRQ